MQLCHGRCIAQYPEKLSLKCNFGSLSWRAWTACFEKVTAQVPFKRRRKETRGPEGNTVNFSQHRCMSNYDQSQSKQLAESPEGQGPGREISGLSTRPEPWTWLKLSHRERGESAVFRIVLENSNYREIHGLLYIIPLIYTVQQLWKCTWRVMILPWLCSQK